MAHSPDPKVIVTSAPVERFRSAFAGVTPRRPARRVEAETVAHEGGPPGTEDVADDLTAPMPAVGRATQVADDLTVPMPVVGSATRGESPPPERGGAARRRHVRIIVI